MPIKHEEIIEELEDHIRKFGGEHSEWYVGTAKDARAPFFRRHLAADLGDGLIYREAFTTTAADQVIDHLVNQRGLHLANGAERGVDLRATGAEAERRSALQNLPNPAKSSLSTGPPRLPPRWQAVDRRFRPRHPPIAPPSPGAPHSAPTGSLPNRGNAGHTLLSGWETVLGQRL